MEMSPKGKIEMPFSMLYVFWVFSTLTKTSWARWSIYSSGHYEFGRRHSGPAIPRVCIKGAATTKR
jgi:hypothetical protein